MTPRTKWTIGVVFVFALIGIIAVVFGNPKFDYVSSFLAATIAIILAIYIRRRREKKPDERNIKLARASNSVAWALSYILTAAFLLLLQFEVIELSALNAVSIVFFGMAVIQISCKVIYFKKSDV